MGLSITKYTQSADFCADRTDVIKNFAVIMNVVIKRVHCACILHIFIHCLHKCVKIFFLNFKYGWDLLTFIHVSVLKNFSISAKKKKAKGKM